MRLVVKQKDGESRELQFVQGPVHIGRAADSHVFLPDRTVSKKHATILRDVDGTWSVQDLGSSNKTYLNGQAVQKAQIKTGDAIRITDFTIEICVEDVGAAEPTNPELEDTLNLEAGLSTPTHEP